MLPGSLIGYACFIHKNLKFFVDNTKHWKRLQINNCNISIHKYNLPQYTMCVHLFCFVFTPHFFLDKHVLKLQCQEDINFRMAFIYSWIELRISFLIVNIFLLTANIYSPTEKIKGHFFQCYRHPVKVLVHQQY